MIAARKTVSSAWRLAAAQQVGPVPGGYLLNSGWRIRAAGVQVPVDTFPMASALSADGRHLLVLNGGWNPPSISVIDTAAARELGRTPVADGWLGLTGEGRREIGRPGAGLEDIRVADDLAGRTPVDNMWARSFVRLARDLVSVIGANRPEGEPAGFRDGWRVQRVLDALRTGRPTPLD